MKNPIISLILIYCNHRKNIKFCIESLMAQALQDFELLCINTGSTDESDIIAQNYAKADERVKVLNISENVAKKSAVMLTSGDYVCFVDVRKIYKEDFLSNLYREMVYTKEQKLKIKNETVYNRYFIENSDKIDQMINKHISVQANDLTNTVKSYKEIISKEFERYKKDQIETINNKTYDITVRFDQLEKNYYQNNNEIQNLLKRIMEKCNISLDEEGQQYTPMYNEILKLRYELTSEINNKGSEINKVYEEITNNYKYTENLLSKTREDIVNSVKYENYTLEEKFKNLVNETETKYSAIKSLVDSQINDTDSKLQAVSLAGNIDIKELSERIDIEKLLNENTENIYSRINKINSEFYEELSKIYRELNEKLIAAYKNQELQIEQKMRDIKNELTAEFDIKIQQLRDEMVK